MYLVTRDILLVRRIGPDDLVELDEVDGAPAGEKGVTCDEGPARPISTPAPKGAYILWPFQARKAASGKGR